LWRRRRLSFARNVRCHLQTDEFWSVGGESEAALRLLKRFASPASIGCWREAGGFVAQSLSGHNRCFAPFDDRCPPISRRYRTCGGAVPGRKVLRADPLISSCDCQTPTREPVIWYSRPSFFD